MAAAQLIRLQRHRPYYQGIHTLIESTSCWIKVKFQTGKSRGKK